MEKIKDNNFLNNMIIVQTKIQKVPLWILTIISSCKDFERTKCCNRSIKTEKTSINCYFDTLFAEIISSKAS